MTGTQLVFCREKFPPHIVVGLLGHGVTHRLLVGGEWFENHTRFSRSGNKPNGETPALPDRKILGIHPNWLFGLLP